MGFGGSVVIDVGGYDPKRPIIQASGSYVLEFRGKLRGYRVHFSSGFRAP